MAIWRRNPEHHVIIHSDQWAQFSSDEWNRFWQTYGWLPSMSCRGNGSNPAVVESFFGSLKKEERRRHIFKIREAARAEIFHDIEVFYLGADAISPWERIAQQRINSRWLYKVECLRKRSKSIHT